MLSKVGRKRAEEELNKLLTDDLVDAQNRLTIAKSHGDLRENEPYNIALQDINKIRLRIAHLEEQLSMSTAEDVYSRVISPGTFINIMYIMPDGTERDFGLHMFDAEGSSIHRTISASSELGRKIQGTLGGEFIITDRSGRKVTAIVKVLDEGVLEQYVESVPSTSVGYSEAFKDV